MGVSPVRMGLQVLISNILTKSCFLGGNRGLIRILFDWVLHPTIEGISELMDYKEKVNRFQDLNPILDLSLCRFTTSMGT